MKFYKYMFGLHPIREGMGEATIFPEKVDVSIFLTFRIIYTCGIGIKKGGSIKVGIPHACSDPQIDNPFLLKYVNI